MFGAPYDATIFNIGLETTGSAGGGWAGRFDGSTSQMAIFAAGPFTGGEPISFSMWFKTSESGYVLNKLRRFKFSLKTVCFFRSNLTCLFVFSLLLPFVLILTASLCRSEMVLLNYGSIWDGAQVSRGKDQFMVTLDKGIPAIRIQPTKKVKSLISRSLADGVWHQIVVSMPYKSCLLSEVDIYVDGENYGTNLADGTQDLNIFTITSGRLSLGGVGYHTRAYDFSYPNIVPYNGLLDEFQLWAKPIEDILDFPLLGCKKWCHAREHEEKPWDLKCLWTRCSGCHPCLFLV